MRGNTDTTGNKVEEDKGRRRWHARDEGLGVEEGWMDKVRKEQKEQKRKNTSASWDSK